MTVSCPHCQKDGEHNDVYRGCMRPCPHCGELVSLATLEDAPVKRAPTEECWCGKARDERGLDFALIYRKVDRAPPLIKVLTAIVPFLRLLIDSKDVHIVTTTEGWACEGCASRIRWMRLWLWIPLPMILLFWGALLLPVVLEAHSTGQAFLDTLRPNQGIWTFSGAVALAAIVWSLWWNLLSQPIQKRFGKGSIESVKILEP